MNTLQTLSVLVLLGACAQQVEPIKEAPEAPESQQVFGAEKTTYFPHIRIGEPGMDAIVQTGRCNIRADFSSFASGISHMHFDATVNILSAAPEVEHTYIQPLGREGEQLVCAEIPELSKRADVMGKLDEMMENLGQPRNSGVLIQIIDDSK